MKEAHPLAWPEGWPRTRIQDREERKGWKKTERQSIEALDVELERFGSFGIVITRKDPNDRVSAPDPSASVYFSREREENFGWQDALGISNPAPSVDEINRAYRELTKKYHPDKAADAEMFLLLTKHRDNALGYARQLSGEEHQFVIACDKFKEFRWNVNAIRMTIASLRQMERDGTSRLLERAMQGFAALTEGTHVAAAGS